MPIFFCEISRCAEYPTKKDGSFFGYKHYEKHIHSDCQDRCVYCDVSVAEIGGEGMVLDHFRPQKIFPDLRSSPFNLVISCPRCNRLKWHNWPVSPDINQSHDGVVGFIDPFLESRLDYIRVGEDGTIEPLKGPAPYLVELMDLNRTNRVLVRKRRLLSKKMSELIDLARSTINEVSARLRAGTCTDDHAARLELASRALTLALSYKGI